MRRAIKRNFMEAIEAIIWLISTDEGGKYSPVYTGWCPHLIMAQPHNDENGQPIYMGVHLSQIGAGEIPFLSPAENCKVTFQLMYFDEAKPDYVELYFPLQPGREFEIREGRKTVGTGCVQRRFND